MTHPDSQHRALDAPFTPPDEWDPIPGACSCCGGEAALGETKWWHIDGPCQSRGRRAEFIPD